MVQLLLSPIPRELIRRLEFDRDFSKNDDSATSIIPSKDIHVIKDDEMPSAVLSSAAVRCHSKIERNARILTSRGSRPSSDHQSPPDSLGITGLD